MAMRWVETPAPGWPSNKPTRIGAALDDHPALAHFSPTLPILSDAARALVGDDSEFYAMVDRKLLELRGPLPNGQYEVYRGPRGRAR